MFDTLVGSHSFLPYELWFMSLNNLNVGKLKFIIASLKGLSAQQLAVELDRLCVGLFTSFYNRLTKSLFRFIIVLLSWKLVRDL